jgi:hypothetical protein
MAVNAGETYVPLAPQLPENCCHRCGGHNPSWHAPNELWNKVMRVQGEGSEPYAGMVCPSCFMLEAMTVLRILYGQESPHFVIDLEDR